MFDFKKIKDGSINIVGLNSELECIYIDDLYKKNNSNILVVVNSIYEANKLYNSQPYIRSYNLCKIINLFTILDFY